MTEMTEEEEKEFNKIKPLNKRYLDYNQVKKIVLEKSRQKRL